MAYCTMSMYYIIYLWKKDKKNITITYYPKSCFLAYTNVLANDDI